MKKFIALVLALLCILVCAIGCDKKKGEEETTVEEIEEIVETTEAPETNEETVEDTGIVDVSEPVTEVTIAA